MDDTTGEPQIRVRQVGFPEVRDELALLRNRVFGEELGASAAAQADALDVASLHVIARDRDGTAVGAGRLVPPVPDEASGLPSPAWIGRVAVLPAWRTRGVGGAVLLQLLQLARERGWRDVQLDAQVDATAFYRRHGFVPIGTRFDVDGIAHQRMRHRIGGNAVETREEALATTVALVQGARRSLWIYSRELDPGLLDAPQVLAALRRLATARRQAEIRILLQDAAAPQRAQAPLLALAQRLPSSFVFREVADPVDRAYPAAFACNDAGGFYFRGLGHRLEGEADLASPGRARQLRAGFDRVWERSRPVTEYRALGL